MKQFLLKIYIYRFLDAIKLIGVIFTLLFQANGLNPFQISLLIGIWSATQLLLEVPLGVLADKFSRRNLLITGVLLLAITYSLWLKGGLLFYALGFVLWGVKNALTSGTLESFVYDELKSYGSENLYEKVNGRVEGSFWVGVMLSALLGGILAQIGFNWVLVSSIATSVLAAITLLTIRDVKAVRSTGEAKYFVILREAWKEIRSNGRLIQIIVFMCLTFAVYGAADEYWPLIFSQFNVGLGIVGILMASVYGIFSLSGYTVHHFNTKNNKYLEYMLIIVSGVLFILSGLSKSILGLPIILIGIYLFKVASVKFDARFQHSIQAEQRATISSLKSLLNEIVYLVSVLLFGFFSTQFGLRIVLYILGGVIIVSTLAIGRKLSLNSVN